VTDPAGESDYHQSSVYLIDPDSDSDTDPDPDWLSMRCISPFSLQYRILIFRARLPRIGVLFSLVSLRIGGNQIASSLFFRDERLHATVAAVCDKEIPCRADA
jgi:hypothetical protein